MNYIFLFIFLCVLVPLGTAEDVGILEILGISTKETWNGEWNSLKAEDVAIDKNVSATANMEACVDIIGFGGLYKKDGVFYYLGDPVNNTVVKCEIKDYLTASKCRWNDNVDWIVHSESFRVQNGTVSVISNITMLWHHSKKRANGKGIKKTYYYDHLTVNDTDILPMVHIGSMDSVSAHIKICNNTFSPKTLIVIPESNRLKTEIIYKNESIVYYDNVGFVEYTVKGYPYVNLTGGSSHVSYDNDFLKRIGPYYCIVGPNFSESDLSILIHGLYTNESINEYTIFEETYEPSKVFHPSMFLIIGILLIFSMGIYKIWRMYK